MKCLFLSLIACMAAASTADALVGTYCASLGGNWTTSASPTSMAWSLQQDVSGNITGTDQVTNCGGIIGNNATLTITGRVSGDGIFTLNGTSNNQNCLPISGLIVTIPLGTVGCQQAQFPAHNGQTWYMNANVCLNPPGGNIAAWVTDGTGWDPAGKAKFHFNLGYPTGQTYYNWGGRTISYVNHSMSQDCAPQTITWPVNMPTSYQVQPSDTNTITDWAGWTDTGTNASQVRYYDELPPGSGVPCTMTYYEDLQIDCTGGNQTFQTNIVNRLEVEDNTHPAPLAPVIVTKGGSGPPAGEILGRSGLEEQNWRNKQRMMGIV